MRAGRKTAPLPAVGGRSNDHAAAVLIGAATGAAFKGVFRGATMGGSQPNYALGDGDDEAPEPLSVDSRPAAKARSQPSRGSQESPHPWPAPSKPFVDPSSYNGTGVHAIYIGTDEEDEAPGPAAAAARPRGRPVAQRDVRLAQETLAANANYGRGHRRRGA